jgi:hypothetical protein
VSRSLIIETDLHGLSVSAGTVGKGKASLDRVALLPDDSPPLSPETAKALGQRTRDLMKQAGIAAAPVTMLVGRDKLILKEVRHPAVAGAEEPAIVRFQAVKDVTENADDLVLDYLPLGTTPEGERRSLAVFIRRDLLVAARQFCEAAGLRLASLLPRPFAAPAALAQALASGAEPPDGPDDAVAVISTWETGGEFCVVRGGELLFSRSVSRAGLTSESALVGEIRRNLIIVGGLIPSGVTAVYVAEADAPGGGWAGRLHAALDVPVRSFDPLAGTPAAANVPPEFRGRLAASTGALRMLAGADRLPIDFVTPRQPKAEPNKNRQRYLLLALAAILLLAAGFFAGFYLDDQERKKLVDLNAKKKDVGDELQQMLQDARRAEAAEEFEKHSLRLHDELYDLTSYFPDVSKVRVTLLDYSAVPLPNKKDREERKKAGAAANVARPVGNLTMNILTDDKALVSSFVSQLANESRSYVAPIAQGGETKTGSNTGPLNQSLTVRMGLLPRTKDQYVRKLNVTLPKLPEKSRSRDPEDEFFGGGGGFPSFNLPNEGVTP